MTGVTKGTEGFAVAMDIFPKLASKAAPKSALEEKEEEAIEAARQAAGIKKHKKSTGAVIVAQRANRHELVIKIDKKGKFLNGNTNLMLELRMDSFKDMCAWEGKKFVEELLTAEGIGKEDAQYAIEGALAGHIQRDVQLPVIRKDATTAWLLATMVQRRNAADEVEGVTMVCKAHVLRRDLRGHTGRVSEACQVDDEREDGKWIATGSEDFICSGLETTLTLTLTL